MLVQPSFDSRMVAQKLSDKAISFIENNAKDPFFMYFGFRSGHHPFVSHPKFRGKENLEFYTFHKYLKREWKIRSINLFFFA